MTDDSTLPEGIPLSTDEPAGEPLAETNGHGLFDRLRFWRRGQTWLEISGYHVEDIFTDQPVAIQDGATLVGNVIAPRLVVAGLLTGSAVCRDIRVERKGQVLGDVFTVGLTILNGGNVHGWVSSVDEADYAQLVTNGRLPDDNEVTRHETGHDLPEGQLLNRNEAQVEALHHLQTQAAIAQAARAELEQDFQRRLTELAGESTSTIANLKQELTELRTELTTKQTQLDEAQEALRHRKSQVERQANELAIARDLMTEQNDELANLRQQHTLLQNNHTQLQTGKTAADDELESAIREINTLRDRIHSLEVAHKASLQHTSEQEESLIRWQELAEITEKKVEELEAELQKMQSQLEEGSTLLELQREQRKAAEIELDKVLNELADIREKTADPLAKIEQLAQANQHIAQLEAELADAEHAHFERVLWYKAELEASQAAAANAEKTVAEQTERLTQMENELAAHQKAVTELETAVSEAQSSLETTQADWTRRYEELVEQNMGLQTVIQEQKVQLESGETELNRFLNQVNAQGHHLAEIQARLVERELQLKQAIAKLKEARGMIEKQNQAIKQIQQKAGERIQKLKEQIAQTP
ncbi:MAG: polymer-forming cytoskeletal protein [Ardenticatenaceae bacterium]|nr:polymer-forming cytoskeletal protein [Anaerolineales bacterium]MCB8941868.1 polymer-forming cytoskeletal protein [Ardenticatenaceae bacterium]MCB8972982.1 polymer-forming cytoskeletal protein [Ardenticatenaceae bacterium]